MKALIISDIHSNIYSLRAIWEKESDSEVIYCAGDLVDYGPFPKEVIQWCRSHQAVCVKGNHDEDVISHFRSGRRFEDIPEDERTWAHHNTAQLAEEEIQYLESLPEHIEFVMDGISYIMQHSFRYRSYETMDNIQQFRKFWAEHNGAMPKETGHKRAVFGHTHNQAVHYLSNQELWLNPGSTSYRPSRQSEDLSQDAHYMTITDGEIQIKSVEYDLTPLFEAVKELKLKDSQLKVAHRFFKQK